MSGCDLDLWSLDLELLQHFECPVFKLCTKFERNRIIHGWVIDDLAHFRVQFFLGGGAELTAFSRVRAWTQLRQTWQGHRAIIAALHFCFRFRACCIFKRGRLKVEWFLNDAKFALFTPLWKLGEGWARSLLIVEALRPTTNLRNTFDGHPLRGCWARWNDKKEKEKLTSVGLKNYLELGGPLDFVHHPHPIVTPQYKY